MVVSSPSDSLVVELPHGEATLALGAQLARHAEPGLLVALHGPLGAGKTTLARGFIQAWTGRDEDAPSPTYTLVQTYEGERGMVWHVDLYRLKSPEEIEDLGLPEALEEAVCLVEWAERLGAWLARDHISVGLSLAAGGRIAQIAWRGGHPAAWFRTLA